MRYLKALTLSLALVCLSGCGHMYYMFADPIAPKVVFKSVEVKKASLLGVSLLVYLDIKNPNDFALSANSLQYSAYAFGKRLAKGTKKKLFIPANGTGMVKLPLKLSSGAVLQLAAKIAQGLTQADVTIRGSGIFESPAGDLDLDFEKVKKVKLKNGKLF